MELTKATIDKTSILRQTEKNLYFIERMKERILKFDTDSENETRYDKQVCKFCYYLGSRAGGAACSSRPCAMCETTLHSGNTCVDILCKGCAIVNKLCTCCGGDIDLKPKRRRDR